MAASTRYAIYFVPAAESALYRFGSGMIGYDCYIGAETAAPPGIVVPEDWAELTRAPRRYGFHATLKAPFRLAPEHDEASLIAAVSGFAARARKVASIRPVVRVLSGFIAIVPDESNATLNLLAADCVTAFDSFRAPPSPQERARRLAANLTARQRSSLERWGYPYVFEDFRFHMTLTDRVPEARQTEIRGLLSGLMTQYRADALVFIDRIALLRQDHERSPFRVVMTAIFGGA